MSRGSVPVKGALIAQINRALETADLPPFPVEVMYSLPIRHLELLKDRWVATVCVKLIARRVGSSGGEA